MKNKKLITPKEYKRKNKTKAKIITKAVKRGAKQYAETFRRLAVT